MHLDFPPNKRPKSDKRIPENPAGIFAYCYALMHACKWILYHKIHRWI